jgi:hypothetical protein
MNFRETDLGAETMNDSASLSGHREFMLARVERCLQLGPSGRRDLDRGLSHEASACGK